MSESRYLCKVLTVQEMEEILNASSADEDEDDAIVNVNILPPERVDELTDQEDFDDELVCVERAKEQFKDICGSFEIERAGATASDVVHEPDVIKSPLTTKKIKNQKPKGQWVPRGHTTYDLEPLPGPLIKAKEHLHNEIKDCSPIDLFNKFFTNDVLDYIIKQSTMYARQNNNMTFQLDRWTLKRFLGILIISGFHTVPQISDYWSQNPLLGVKVVQNAMSRNRFWEIKRYLHFADNTKLDKNDKMGKVICLVSNFFYIFSAIFYY